MPAVRLAALVTLAMLAFAGNSLLCRMALKHTTIDAATFTAMRLVSGAFMLWLMVRIQSHRRTGYVPGRGNWASAAALFVYAAGFSFAYVGMTAATGALLLFGAVQATMIGAGLLKGERMRGLQLAGFALAIAGLVLLVLPGLSTPSWSASLSMLGAGVAWGVYSLRGKKFAGADPIQVTAGNFLRAVPMTLVLSAALISRANVDAAGLGLAAASGAIASGLGYTIWYTALPALKATHAATLQLSVPVIAALGGIVMLGEQPTPGLVLATCAILGGISLVIFEKK